ncbi:Lectin receptor kinase [Rhynchospora pubera]|uniref:Lectin receptor kinase n=1 Tax=Rhynchospora pubera TaxID=906938 RepID=A0AAV8GVT4_9POAL|nr:Lectin receptor kinase [Rhynchospora pubera]
MLLLLYLLLFCPFPTTSTFTRSRISWTSNITLFSDASLLNSSISLTSLNASSSNIGHALYSIPMRFLDPTTETAASFSTRFTFSIIPSPSFGDGLAFLITSDQSSFDSSNGSFGIFGPGSDCTSKHSAIAVEFDTNLDPLLRDLDDNHVAVDACSILSSASSSAVSADLDLKTGVPMTAWVEYLSQDKELRVWLSYNSKHRPPNPLLVAGLDLSELVHEFMYVGFSASNGPGTALHLIHRWSFRTFGLNMSTYSLPPPTGNHPLLFPPLNTSGDGFLYSHDPSLNTGGDGFLDFHEDEPDIEISEPYQPNSKQTQKLAVLVLGVLSASTILLAGLVIVVVMWKPLLFSEWRAVKEQLHLELKERYEEDDPQIEDELGNIPGRITVEEIMAATNGFNRRKILGWGSTATVYAGTLSSGSKVAVKRFAQAGRYSHMFASEVAAIVASCQHRNLVPLTGWCCDGEELMLVYEYMPNGTLHGALHGICAPLSWNQRKKIIVGVAMGLEFLHSGCDQKILHRDVKASNILLDTDFTARLGDLGLAQLNRHGNEPQPTAVVGTPGYMDPEYVLTGLATEESDVYSFGVVALEVATGRLPMEGTTHLVNWVWTMRSHKRLADAADPRLEGRFEKVDMVRVLLVGLACSYPNSTLRPSMRTALMMLEGTAPLPSLPSKKPEFKMPPQLLPDHSSEEGSSTYYSF